MSHWRHPAVPISIALSLGIAACGSSGSKTSATSSAPPTTSTAATTTSAAITVSHARKHPQSTHVKKHQPSTPAKKHTASTHKQHTTPAKSPTTTTTTTTTKTTPAKTGGSSSHSTPTVPPLSGPVVSGSAGGMRATLHADNHAPTVGKLWHYSVLATDAGGHPLSGSVDTEFVFGKQVVGHESPPTHPLSNGRLDDKVTFPPQSVGVPLTFQVVVHTHLGTVTLDWAVKSQH